MASWTPIAGRRRVPIPARPAPVRRPGRSAGGALAALALCGVLAACAPTSGEEGGFDPVKTTNTDFDITLVETGKRPIFMAVADIDGDGSVDVATADRFDNTVTVHTENFTTLRTVNVGTEPTDVLFGDLDGAFGLDMVVLSELGMRLSTFLDDGAGGWDATHLDLEGIATQVSLIDLNNDGSPTQDIVISVSTIDRIKALVNAGDGTFTEQTSPTLEGPQRFVIGFWDGDNNPDLAIVHPREDKISVMTGDGGGLFDLVQNNGISVKDNPIYIVSADFNGDGDADLAISNRFTDRVTVLLGKGTGGFEVLKHIDVKAGPAALVAGAFTGGGAGAVDDLAVVHRSKRTVTILTWQSGEAGFQEEREKVSRDPFAIAAGDFNDDGLTDLVTAESDERVLSVLAGDGAGRFDRTVVGFTSGPSFPVVVDLDFNGTDDLLLLQTQSNRLVVLENVH